MTLPSGTVTLLFTDIEGSTSALERLGERYAQALTLHRRLLREAFGRYDGHEVDTQGDAFFVAFSTAEDALAAASAGQKALTAAEWPEGVELRVRMGIHTGRPALVGDGYVGLDVHKGARICSAGHGGQVLVSADARGAVGEKGPAGLRLRDLGEYRLKDFTTPERLYQLDTEGTPREFPRLRSLRPSNLPVDVSTLIGRSLELSELDELLHRGDVRHLSLVGPGGIGKTRLALATVAAAHESGAFSSGAFFVPLASISDHRLIPSAMAAALDLSGSSAQSPFEAVKAFLADKSMLLLLDNFEHLLDGASAVPELLAASRGLKIVVTSRASLRTTGEHEYHVAPLALPQPMDEFDSVAASDAVALFVARAQAVDPSFLLSVQNAGAVAEICSRLDGLPLALELAAARVNVLTPEKLRTRLGQSLPVLVGGSRDAPERHRTLRATIAWSYELLSEEERRLFARLAVFRGGSTLDAIEEICEAELDTLASVVDKSLLRKEQDAAREPRYVMLETIREYALERLDEMAESSTLRRRHAAHFLTVAEAAERELKGTGQLRWLERLEAEHDNLRGALHWSLNEGDAGLGLSLAARLWLFWYMHGHVTEGRRWLAAAIERSESRATAVRAKALDGAGYLAGEQGDDARQGLLEASLSCARAASSPEDVAIAATHLSTALPLDELDRAWQLGEEAVSLARRADDEYTLAVALNNLGVVAVDHRDYARATELFEESLQLRRRLGDASRIALSLLNLGEMAFMAGDTTRAQTLLSESLERAIGIGDKRHMCFSLDDLGWVALGEGRYEDSGNLLRQSLALARELGHKLVCVELLRALSAVAAGMELPDRAGRLASAVASFGEPAATNVNPIARVVYESRVEDVQTAYRSSGQRAREEGAAMDLAAAIEYALSDD